MTDEHPETRQEKREKRRVAKEAKMQKHGKGLAQTYRNAILKRLGLQKPPGKSNP